MRKQRFTLFYFAKNGMAENGKNNVIHGFVKVIHVFVYVIQKIGVLSRKSIAISKWGSV